MNLQQLSFHRAMVSRVVWVVLVLFALGVLMRVGFAQPSSEKSIEATAGLATLQQSLANLIDAASPAVVAVSRAPGQVAVAPSAQGFPSAFTPFPQSVRGRPSQFEPTGVGVVIDASGLVLTQYLNVRPGDRHTISTSDGRQLPATIKAADPRSGLAVLEVKTTELPALPLGDADKLRKGHIVITIGNPQSIIRSGQATASCGSVTNLAQRATPTTNLNNARDESGTYATTLHHLGTLLQTDAKLNWVSGGAAVIDISGKLVGITTTAGTLPGHESAAGYAIPMTSTFRRIVDDLKTGREVEYGLLGLSLQGPDRNFAESSETAGAVVASVVRGSAADRAGLKQQDRLIGIDGKPIETVSDLQLLVSSLPPNKPVNVKLFRTGKQMELSVSLSKLFVPGDKVVTVGMRSWRGLQVDYSTALSTADREKAALNGLVDPQGCVAVVSVASGSAADEAGIEPGMFVSHVGSQRVTTPDEFYEAVEGTKETVLLKFTEPDNRPDEQTPPVEVRQPEELN